MTGYYVTNSADPDAPVELNEYNGLKPGDRVRYENPAGKPLRGPLVLSALYQFGDKYQGAWVAAILNDGKYEVDAANLRPAGEPSA